MTVVLSSLFFLHCFFNCSGTVLFILVVGPRPKICIQTVLTGIKNLLCKCVCDLTVVESIANIERVLD